MYTFLLSEVIMRYRAILLSSLFALVGLFTTTSSIAAAEESKGWDRTVRVKEYLEQAIPHDSQQKAALEKLKQLKTKNGRQPNILIILVDDLGYGDVGCNGGGEMTGAPTPNIDRIAHE